MACLHTTWSSTPQTSPPAETPPGHSRMFVPSTTGPEPPPVKAGPLERFDRARAAGTVRKAIEQAKRQATSANEHDGKLRASGGDR